MKKNKSLESISINIVELIERARENVVRHINHTMVATYFEIGRMIVEEEQKGKQRANYGSQLISGLSIILIEKFGRGFSQRNLEQMRQFYLRYSIPQKSSAESVDSKNNNQKRIPQKLSAESLNSKNKNQKRIPQKSSAEFKANISKFNLSWSHYLKLMRVSDINERNFYEIESFQNNWSLSELQRQMDSALYNRLALSRNKKKIKELSSKGLIIESAIDAIKDPYILEFTGLEDKSFYSESDLESKLIDKLEHFILELGKGFTFEARQKRISIDEKHFKIDLVFYNRILKSFVIIDLKIGELKHQDIGQMQMYVNYYDRFEKLEDENKTIGIILCQDKSDTLVEITLPENNKQIFASRYKTVLPSKKELKNLLNEKN